jgi:hypothetical protein
MFTQGRSREVLGSSAVVAAGVAVFASWVPGTSPTTSRQHPSQHGLAPAVVIERAPLAPTAAEAESHKRGSERWRLQRPALDRQIEGYATRVGAPAGAAVGLRVSTDAPRYRVRAFRIGSYRGGTGRQVWQSHLLSGRRQPAGRLSSGPGRTVVAPWTDSVMVSTEGWPEGFYVFKLVASTGWHSHVPYVVTSRTVRGKVVLVAPVTTWQAYNDWGGYSLYESPPRQSQSWTVSFDRPYPSPGSGQFLFGVAPVLIEAERLGIPLGYLTNLDLEAREPALKGAAAYVSMGHDEYWTLGMRRSVLRARDQGTNLVFLGANTMYWRIRTSAGPTGPDRLVTGFRHDAALDRATLRGDPDSTARFRDPPHPRPENSLTGMLYECFPVDAPLQVASPRWWGYRGTGVRRGDSFDNLVGVEADRAYPVPSTPRPLQVVAHVRYSCGGVETSAQSVYYTAASGAGVFNAGTLRWTCALSARCGPSFEVPRGTRRFVRRVTHNVLRAFARGPAAERFPAHDNLGSYALPKENLVPAS